MTHGWAWGYVTLFKWFPNSVYMDAFLDAKREDNVYGVRFGIFYYVDKWLDFLGLHCNIGDTSRSHQHVNSI
jgi:hypothetical protein